MSNDFQKDHLKAVQTSNLYNQLNENTVYQYEQQSEQDKKLKIRRLKIVQLDERAKDISKILQSQNKKQSKTNKATKSSDISLPEEPKIAKKMGRPKKPKIVKPKPKKPIISADGKEPIKIKDPVFKMDEVWNLYTSGLSNKEIAIKLGIPRRHCVVAIYDQKKKLGLDGHPHKGKLISGTKTEKIYNLYKEGLSNKEISVIINETEKYVSSTLTRARKQLGESIPANPLTKQIHELKKQGKKPTEISKILNISIPQTNYYFYKKQP